MSTRKDPQPLDNIQAMMEKKAWHYNPKYFNNASAILPLEVDIAASPEERNAQITSAMHTLVFGEDDSMPTLNIKTLGGGLSNTLFVVTSADPTKKDDEASWLVRIHFEMEEELVQRSIENEVCAWLSAEQLAPLFYGRFQNGRIEEFYPNTRTLTCHEMKQSPQFAPPLARALAHLHKRTLPPHISQLLRPQQSETNNEATPFYGNVWDNLDSWFDLAIRQIEQQPKTSSRKEDSDWTGLDVANHMRQEWTWLKKNLMTVNGEEESDSFDRIQKEATDFCHEICFTHMDLQSLNILTKTTLSDEPTTTNHDSLKVIDFEYAGLNPRAADLANTFCEHCDMNNLKAQYETQYPTDEEQNVFLEAYLQETKPEFLKPNDVKSKCLAAMRHEIGKYTLVSHMGWAIWAICQHFICTIEFDYLGYARHRMDGYRYFKQKYWLKE